MFIPYFYSKLINAQDGYKQFMEAQMTPTIEEIHKREAKVLALSKLQKGIDFQLADIPFKIDQIDQYIHTFIGVRSEQDMKKDSILLLHGYGGTLAQFYKIYPSLMQIFRVYAIDLPGMGLSSKNGFIFTQIQYQKGIILNNVEQTLDFFLGALDQWRQYMGIDKMIVLGHSFGGHIAAQYANRYPERIKCLILLSPAGTTTITEDDISRSRKKVIGLPWIKQKAYNISEIIWNNKMTPQLLYSQWYGPLLVDHYLTQNLDLNDHEQELVRSYSDGILKVPTGSEESIFQLFNLRHFPELEPVISIEVLNYSQMKQLFCNRNTDFPIYFLFGQKDWMNRDGAINLQQTNNNVFIIEVDNCGHQINIENPAGTVKLIFEIYNKHCKSEIN